MYFAVVFSSLRMQLYIEHSRNMSEADCCSVQHSTGESIDIIVLVYSALLLYNSTSVF